MAEVEAEVEAEGVKVEVEMGPAAGLGVVECADAGVVDREMDDGVEVWAGLLEVCFGVGIGIGLVCFAGAVVVVLYGFDTRGRVGLVMAWLRLVAGRVLGSGCLGLLGRGGRRGKAG